MKIEKIKPTPKYILAKIEKLDQSRQIKPCGLLRFYSYLTKNDGELVKVTVAVKVYKDKWYCKQVAVHGLHSDKCFCRDIEYSYMEDITVDSVARTFGFERSYLYRMFKERYGMGVKDYIIKTRIERAKELLSEGFSVCDTAALVGYRDQFNFSRSFKSYYGHSPSDCREGERSGDR